MGDQLSNTDKKDILKALFDKDVEDDGTLDEYSEYFDFFQDQTRQPMIENVILKANMCKNIQNAVKDMQQHPDTTLRQLVDRLKSPPSPPYDDHDLRALVDCALRVWIGVNSRRPARDGSFTDAGETYFCWDGELPLCDFIWGVFYPGKRFGERPNLERDEMVSETATAQSRLTHPLTAVNLERYPRIKTHWTPYLNDHLRFSVSYKQLQVFWQKKWLQDAKSFLEERREQCRLGPGADEWGPINLTGRRLPPYPVPAEVLEEALMSLDYLFPNAQQTVAFLQRHNKTPSFPKDERPRLKQFEYYHDRLIEVAQEFLNPARDWRTIWSDNRNPVQFLTFWFGLLVVLLIILFGIIASVLAGLQYRAALYPPSNAGAS
ncbi:hypothetical protein F4859DRAFT_526848 [Xylaria cf. heliscus]|nr:hypothetical protein F4859DRAFT_526848 [Xylaria cf. heliscus]